ncbi:hypothetical protein SAMN04489716_2639 [Actinoplanes derwentensis]|uniref:Uncharacterized protein n=2 Tax=Actinoplanes derwentensis TaxID=113562 RepID=A0A1H1XYH8_9ACTN|nr:hypothetical protein SAMN04489716_2639 [Actinoplanes derwentensis]
MVQYTGTPDGRLAIRTVAGRLAAGAGAATLMLIAVAAAVAATVALVGSAGV